MLEEREEEGVWRNEEGRGNHMSFALLFHRRMGRGR